MYLLLFAETIQLFPDGTLLIHVGLILVMIWVLNRTLYKPINQIIEAREKNKGGRSSEAVGILKDVEAKEARYTSQMLEARSAGYALIEEEQKRTAAEREKRLAEAKAEIAAKFDSGKVELTSRTSEARETLGTEAEKLADQIAANILRA